MQEELSRKELLSRMSIEDRNAFIADMTDEQIEDLLTDWDFLARPKQRTPQTNWRYWLLLAGRGFGKTLTGANFIHQEAEKARLSTKNPRPVLVIGLVGYKSSEVEKVMIKGAKCGLLNTGNPKRRPKWVGGKNGTLTWKDNKGVYAIAHAVSGETPEAIRGPEYDIVWIDELAKFRYLKEVWTQLQFATGRASPPRTIITTTPKPLQLLRDLVNNVKCYVTRGSSYENSSLTEEYKEVLEQFKGTRQQKQEIEGIILDDVKGALWSREIIHSLDLIEYRDKFHKKWDKNVDFTIDDFLKDMVLVVVAVDPATTATIKSDETGIIVAAKDQNGYGYVIDDLSGKYSVEEWTTKVAKAYEKYGANYIVAEKNQGGDMVESSMKNVNNQLKIKLVHAKVGKIARAEPISLLYDQKKIFHMKYFIILEDQMCNFTGKLEKNDNDIDSDTKVVSPDRMDAMVYALTELFIQNKEPPRGNIPFKIMSY